jgi:hypothetical protein
MNAISWIDIILDVPSPTDAWEAIFEQLQDIAMSCSSPVDLHNKTVAPDRLLAEAAWELWESYPDAAPRTSSQLQEWCSAPSSTGRAVLVLDALSLREMPWLLGGAQTRSIHPIYVRVTGAESPSDTNQFARALGLPSRSSLSGNNAPGKFDLFPNKGYTDVIGVPFEDSIGGIPHESNVFVWHTWLDDLIHVHKKLPDQIYKAAYATLQDDGFWRFVDRLRQGRKLIITSDHGYAVSKLFSSEEMDQDAIEELRETFGAARYRKAESLWQSRFMPPIVVSHNQHYVVMGQRKWKVHGGFPHVCHGGLSLLEVAVPFIEFPPL